MKKLALTAILASLTMLAGCIPCLRAIYTEKDLVFEPALVGQWSPPGSKETWQFSKAGEKSYRVVHTDEKGKSGAFAGHLVRLDGTLFLDLFPEEPELPQSDFYKSLIGGLHTFVLVEQVTPKLRMAIMGPRWLKEHLRENPDVVRHEKIDGRIVLTASTKQLQEFLVKHRKTKGAFREAWNMPRQKPQK